MKRGIKRIDSEIICAWIRKQVEWHAVNTILFFTPLSARGGAQKLLAGAQTAAERLGAHLQVVGQPPDAASVRELVRLWRPLGAIVNGYGGWGGPSPGPFGRLPVVVLGLAGAPPPGAFSVTHDSEGTGRLAARELLATGFRHFAYVPSVPPRPWSEARGRAFAETVRLHGLDVRSMAGPAAEGAAWQRSLRAFLRGLPKPCGLFAANDAVATEVLAAARFLGIAVPNELAVLGVDDQEELCERAVPTLSSVEQDHARAGWLAVRALAGGAAGTAREWTYGDLGVVRRASTRPLATADACAARALALIRREACAGLRAARVAALFPCSRRMADIRFRKAVGRSIGEEIRAVRLEEAKRLAATPGRPLKVVADLCGFGSPGSLRNFFRRETGASLTAWRRSSLRS